MPSSGSTNDQTGQGQRNLYNAMFDAVEAGNLNEVKSLLRSAPDLAEQAPPWARAWADIAAAAGKLEMLKFWLRRQPELGIGRKTKGKKGPIAALLGART